MIKILFFIHDLGCGGAEKVLVNLVNNMDPTRFDITVFSLFGGGINEQFLKSHIHYKAIFRKAFPANSHLLKFFSPSRLHKWFIKDCYNIEVSYLEGPSARIVSGCPHPQTRLVSWIHIEQHSLKRAASSFRSYQESVTCYENFDRTICVSNSVKKDFSTLYPTLKNLQVLYNTNESEHIHQLAQQHTVPGLFKENEFKLCFVGKVINSKGIDRLARIYLKLRQNGFPVHVYILGIGSEQKTIDELMTTKNENDTFTFLGYQTNPYKYLTQCDLFVCASRAEGFSTAATEALILGVPVVTTDVSGMKEMLGENNDYGVVVPQDEEALYKAIKDFIVNRNLLNHYRSQAAERGHFFSTENTVKAVEEMFDSLI